MRYEKGHKDATRAQILDVACKLFRRDGIQAVGIAGLMAGAGLTHGGFYAHFASKEELARDAMTTALAKTKGKLERLIADSPDPLEAVIRAYLDPRHRDRPESGCAAAAAGPELARLSAESRRAIADGIEDMVALFAAHIPASGDAERRHRATAIFGLLIGALQLARIAPDEARSRQILGEATEAALALGRGQIGEHHAQP